MSRPIKIWPFHEAPLKYQALSPHGGDEDWLGLVPPGTEVPMFMEAGTRFGRCDVSEHHHRDGTVVIGAHA